MANPECILISGSTGYVGANVAASFSREGIKVLALARLSSDLHRISTYSPDATIVVSDGSVDSLRSILATHQPTCVVNIAAHFISEHVSSDIPALLKSNFEFPVSLLEASVAEGVRSFISAGTYWEEWSNANPNPVNLYAALKSSFKEILKFYTDAYKLKTMHLRLPDIYGPNDPRMKLFYWLRQSAASSKPLEMTPGLQRLNLVHISDINQAFLIAAKICLAKSDHCYLEFGLFHPTNFTLREVVSIYQDVIKRPVPILWGHRTYRNREVMKPRIITKLPGWQPQLSLADGIADMERSVGGILHENHRE